MMSFYWSVGDSKTYGDLRDSECKIRNRDDSVRDVRPAYHYQCDTVDVSTLSKSGFMFFERQ